MTAGGFARFIVFAWGLRTRRMRRDNKSSKLSFRERIFAVQNCEITIRELGGLLASYDHSAINGFGILADDLGRRLLYRFSIRLPDWPYRFGNLKTGKPRNTYLKSPSPHETVRC